MGFNSGFKGLKQKKGLKPVKRKTRATYKHILSHLHVGDQTYDSIIFYVTPARHKWLRMILIWIFRKRDMGLWIGSSWLRIGTGGGHL